MRFTTIFSIILVIALLGFGFYAMRSDEGSNRAADYTRPSTTQQNMNTNTNPAPEMSVNAEGLGIQIFRAGSGPAATTSNTVVVHYVGTLEDGTKFDSSVDRGQPFSFTLGEGSVIAGWEQGILGMQVGEQRRLQIPSELGYGAAGAGGVIPPNATLLFDVELLEIK
jgi:FKBP-type peptidyl-prolyl cis-trans isomerase